ncbi:glycoside hydrolase family 13 protein [Salinibacter altiplanensis]|uniref:glycoside hydrolase family 13 protein n=1 Tax=Salinibacter altiplanensis TaxID=1803181 RepID=UPI000C9F5D76|nr:glycoside hydrolase family 13 protein [Salinibacter altiplanensis]
MQRILAAVLLLLAGPALAFAQAPEIDRIDPPFWWVNMERSTVELMVYGENLATTRVGIGEHPGVTLDRVTEVDNPNYLFVRLRIADTATPGTVPLHFRHDAGTLTRDFELRPRRTDPYAQGFSSEDVIYLLMPDRFANGAPENDSIPGFLEGVDRSDPDARHGGDFAGIREHLDYIDDLGMTALWMTPIFENDMPPDYGAYHGYAATDMYRVDPRFGSNDAFRRLVEGAHERDLKVIMDMIHNHIGARHWWMDDPPTSNWVHDFDTHGTTNHEGAAVIDPYASARDRAQLTDAWFVPSMPDLNQDNDLLATYLIQNTLWWIESTGIDGIRMDTYFYADKEYMTRWTSAVREEYPDFNIVGESWVPTVSHEAYWQDDFPASPDGYDSDLPSVTDFPLSFAMRDAFAPDGDIHDLYRTLTQDHVYPEPNKLVTFLDNHDLDRFFSVVDADENAFRLAYTFLMTTRGIPQVYYATELMQPMLDVQGDGAKRADMPGGWPGDSRSVFTEEGRTARENGAHTFVTNLTTWRESADVVHHGTLTHFIPQDNTYVYFRHDADDAVMVVLNNAEAPRTLDLDRFAERIQDHTAGRDVISGDTVALGDSLTVPARTPMVLELRE